MSAAAVMRDNHRISPVRVIILRNVDRATTLFFPLVIEVQDTSIFTRRRRQ